MKITYPAVLFFFYILAIPYTLPVKGFFGLPFLVLGVLALPVVSHRIRFNQLSILTGIWLLACAATAIAMISFPEPRTEYIKCVIYYGAALGAGYIALLLILSLTVTEISVVCMAINLIALPAATLEVLVPAVRRVSEQVSARLAPGDDAASSGEAWLEFQSERDERESGGRPRPILGTVEPGRLGFLFGVCLSGWNLTRRRGLNGDLIFVFLATWALLVTRSPTFLTILMAGNFLMLIQMVMSKSIGGVIVLVSFLAAVFLAATIAQERVTRIWEGEDYSINIRFFLPFSFSQVALRDTNGMGIGFIGEIAEPGKRELDAFMPYALEAMEQSNTIRLFHVGFNRFGTPIAIAHSAFATHWTFYGIPFGIAALLFWRSFTRTIGPKLFLPFFVSFLFVGLSGCPYETVIFWVIHMIIFGFLIIHEELRYSDVPAVDL